MISCMHHYSCGMNQMLTTCLYKHSIYKSGHVVSWVRYTTWLYRFLIFVVFLTLVKSAYQKNNFLISQPKHMLWVLKRVWAPKTYAKNYTVSHFSYAPLIKCKITQKTNMIFLFWDYQRKAHLYLHYPLQFHCDQIRNEWEKGSWRALPSKHHFTLHYFERNLVHIALFSGSYFCHARDKSQFNLGNI